MLTSGNALAVAGDDPVNNSDPSGQDVCPPAESGGCQGPPNLNSLSGRESYAYHYYTANSDPMLQPVEASALIGNFIWESGGQLNPNEEGGGIGQWGGPRYTDLQKFGGTTGNQNPSFEAQVAFASHELLGTSSSDDFSVVLTDAETAIVDDGSNVLAQLNDVTEIFELQYECPSGSIGCDTSSATFEPPVNQKNDAWTSLPAREYYAIQIYDLFAGGNIPDPLPGILSSASCGGSGTTTTIA